MGTMKRFEDVEAWQKDRQLTKSIYEVSARDDWARDYGLRDQIRSAPVSVTSNIAEGFKRRGPLNSLDSWWLLKASAAELRSQLYLALDLDYIDQAVFDEMLDSAETVSKMISGLITCLKGRAVPTAC